MSILNNALMIRAVLDRPRKNTVSKAQEKRWKNAQSRTAFAATAPAGAVLRRLGSSKAGLDPREVTRARDTYGENIRAREADPNVFDRVADALKEPFTLILLALGGLSYVTDVLAAAPDEASWVTVIIISIMVTISVGLKVYQEGKSARAMRALTLPTNTHARVIRRGRGQGQMRIPTGELVVGDVVSLAVGTLVPADLRVIEAKDLHVSQAALTGEAVAVQKHAALDIRRGADGTLDLLGSPNLLFAGTDVVGGSGLAVVVAVGDETFVGRMERQMAAVAKGDAFGRGMKEVGRTFTLFMLVMAPLVFLINGLTKGDWLQALLFATTVAVGLTPEMLPMVVTTDLSLGAVEMSKRKVVVRELAAIQTLGAMDVLCSDKTGTLTEDGSRLERWVAADGQESAEVLQLAAVNSLLQAGEPNAVDQAVIDRAGRDAAAGYTLIDALPFDFERRCMSALVEHAEGSRMLIAKGAFEELLGRCSAYRTAAGDLPLTQADRARLMQLSQDLNA